MFRTQYKRERIYTQCGSTEHILYELQADKTGKVDLVPVGKENIYEMIQSYADSVDIHQIIRRFNAGEIDTLNQRVGSFGDITRMPTTYADVLNISIKGKQFFDNLPKDVKKEFGYDFRSFLALMDNPKEFAKRAGVDVMKALGFMTEAAAAGSAANAVDGAAVSGGEAVGVAPVVDQAAASVEVGGVVNE